MPVLRVKCEFEQGVTLVNAVSQGWIRPEFRVTHGHRGNSRNATKRIKMAYLKWYVFRDDGTRLALFCVPVLEICDGERSGRYRSLGGWSGYRSQ